MVLSLDRLDLRHTYFHCQLLNTNAMQTNNRILHIRRWKPLPEESWDWVADGVWHPVTHSHSDISYGQNVNFMGHSTTLILMEMFRLWWSITISSVCIISCFLSEQNTSRNPPWHPAEDRPRVEAIQTSGWSHSALNCNNHAKFYCRPLTSTCWMLLDNFIKM